MQRLAVGGENGCRWAGRALPPSGGGDAVPTAGAKGDVGHLRFPMSPLDTPLTFRWPLSKAFAAKREKRGLGSVRRFGYIELQYPEFTLRSLQRRQCAAIRCRAVALRCEKLRFHQERTLGAPNAPVGPSHLDARPEGVASKGGSGVSRGEKGTIGALSPLVSAGRPRHPRPPKAATVRAHIERSLAFTGCAAVSTEPLTLC